MIEKFLSEFDSYLQFPRIFQVPQEKIVEKIVEKDRIVSLAKSDDRSVKMELTLSLLVEKLIMELKRVRKDNPNVKLQLEDDVNLIFFSELDSQSQMNSGEFSGKLKSFSDSVYRKFESLGAWSVDHQLMLNSFLQERFLMANLVKTANLEIEKAKTSSIKRDQTIRKYETDMNAYKGYFSKIKSSIGGNLSVEMESVLSNIFLEVDKYGSLSR